ncbi:MAG TPA: hypothetical protein VGM39_17385 [Kofleriaceae bacterium]|jgi:hypothetical protein
MKSWIGILVGVALAGCILKQSNPAPGNYGTPNGNGGPSAGDPAGQPGGQPAAAGGQACQPDDVDANGNSLPRRACDPSDGMPIGARVRGESVAFDGTQVCSGGACAFDCPAGNCKFFCTNYAQCDVKCPGGNCQTTCTESARCNLDCAGGNCKSVCHESECDSACPGGKCSFKCDGNRCSDTCSGGDCTN